MFRLPFRPLAPVYGQDLERMRKSSGNFKRADWQYWIRRDIKLLGGLALTLFFFLSVCINTDTPSLNFSSVKNLFI